MFIKFRIAEPQHSLYTLRHSWRTHAKCSRTYIDVKIETVSNVTEMMTVSIIRDLLESFRNSAVVLFGQLRLRVGP
jgi:hypothetical protein